MREVKDLRNAISCGQDELCANSQKHGRAISHDHWWVELKMMLHLDVIVSKRITQNCKYCLSVKKSTLMKFNTHMPNYS